MDSIKKYIIFSYLDIFTALKCLEIDDIYNDEQIWKQKASQYNCKRRKDNSWIIRCKDIALTKFCNECEMPSIKRENIIFNGIAMCFKCSKITNKFKLIDKNFIAHKYMLNETDYSHLPFVLTSKWKHKRKSKHYNENDIIQICCDKYDVNQDGITDKIVQLKEQEYDINSIIEFRIRNLCRFDKLFRSEMLNEWIKILDEYDHMN